MIALIKGDTRRLDKAQLVLHLRYLRRNLSTSRKGT